MLRDLGTIRDIANFNEGTGVTSVTNHRKYDSFGKLISESNSAVDLIFGFTGKQLDEATGLQHNLFRWYDSALGQWLSEDPIGFAAGDENIRRYVGNRSSYSTDPTGLEDPKNKVQEIPEIHRTGTSCGTPVKPTGKGLAINIYGSEENPLYKDYAADPEYDEYFKNDLKKIRLHTSDLESNSVSDICIRNSPVFPIFWQEVTRIAMPGAVVTIAGPKDSVLPIYRDIRTNSLLDGWGQVTTPISFPYEVNGVKATGVEITVITVRINEGCTYVGPTDPNRPASNPKKKRK